MTHMMAPRGGVVREVRGNGPVSQHVLAGGGPALEEGTPRLDPLTNLREVLEACQTERAVDRSLALWLATALENFLDQSCDTLEEAFGLRNGRGGVSWRILVKMSVRDEALRNLARTWFAKLPVSSQAEAIHLLCNRYAASQWRFDQQHLAMPASYAGTQREYVWRAFKSGAAMPLCTRRLRSILSEARAEKEVGSAGAFGIPAEG